MAKLAHDDVLDALTDEIATANAMHVCSGTPTDRATAITASLATVALDAGDYAQANGDTSGRKTTVAQQAALSITASGTATHVALIDATVLLLMTTCTSQALTSGGTVTVPAFDAEVADPV